MHGRSAYLDPSLGVKRDQAATLDLLVDMGDGPSLFEQAAAQHDLEDLLECRVHVMTAGGLSVAPEHVAERIEREAVLLWAGAGPDNHANVGSYDRVATP